MIALNLGVYGPAHSAPAPGKPQIQLSLDTSEADQVLAILALRRAGKAVDEADWQKLFASAPYVRLKRREEEIGKRFNDPARAFTDDGFKTFVLSEDLLPRAAELQGTLKDWKTVDLRQTASRVLQYLPATAVIQAKVFPLIKPRKNSFVHDTKTDPAIFLYLDPQAPAAKFENTVAHELHHIGLSSVESGYDQKIRSLPERARVAAEWMGAFGEGMAMLAAAGGPDTHPHATSTASDRERWDRDMASFSQDLRSVDAFYLDILGGNLATPEAIGEKGGTFYGVQGPWYTVGYRMAVMVERRFGRPVLLDSMLDPRRLLVLYNQAAAEQNSARRDPLPLWSEGVLKQVGAIP